MTTITDTYPVTVSTRNSLYRGYSATVAGWNFAATCEEDRSALVSIFAVPLEDFDSVDGDIRVDGDKITKVAKIAKTTLILHLCVSDAENWSSK